MPITISEPTAAFTLYYHLIGNNNDRSHDLYRPNNPWGKAKSFCHNLPAMCCGLVRSVTSLDDSVFLVTLVSHEVTEQIAIVILNALAEAVLPSLPGDRLVAAIPKGHLMVELVHHP